MLRCFSKIPIRGKRVLLRVDFNVPVVRGKVQDDFRIRAHLPAIQRILREGNACIILSHHSDEGQSLFPLLRPLKKRLGRPVAFIKNPLHPSAGGAVKMARPGAVFLAENLRFWPGEKANSPAFARSISRLGEIFVNDAFGEMHRPYASMIGLPRFLPSLAGPLVRTELRMLGSFLRHPARPYVAILGGAKIKTKLRLLYRALRTADAVLLGGAIADELLRQRKRLPAARNLHLPVDGVMRRGRMLDIGPKTCAEFSAIIREARTIVWNGPMGIVERPPYKQGTLAVARVLARHRRARVLVGGGDTVAFLAKAGLLKKFKYVSTGGGAMITYLAGEKLPGLEALRHAN